MSEKLHAMIKEYQDEKGRLSCVNAYKVAAKLKVPIGDVGEKAMDLGARISACDLGQFGKQPMGVFKPEVLQDLEEIADENGKVFCKEARALAQKSNLKTVRTAIREGGLDVKYCELGCFTEKKGFRLQIKTKTWIENEKGDLLFGKGKTEILELIEQYGSIAKAAEKLNMSYKKAWSHIKILQNNLDDVLVITQKGRGEDAGTKLTPKAHEFIKNYRSMQNDIESYANEKFQELFLKNQEEKCKYK